MKPVMIVVLAALPFFSMPAGAATLQECAVQWNELKAEGKADGLTYRGFSKQCMAGGKADVAASDDATDPKAKAKPKKVASADRLNSPEQRQKRACDAKWKVHKADVKASGWKAYFTFMADCM
jgi:hypothetical protein